MGRKNFVRENSKNSTQARKGMDSLMDVHINALEKNSEEIIELLDLISKKGGKLSEKDKKTLKTIKRELNDLNIELDKMGD